VAHMASAEREPITWVWRLSPYSVVQGRVPVQGVRGQGGEGAKPPEADSVFVFQKCK